jgi:phage terminase small subunit
MNIRARHFAKHYACNPETKGDAYNSAIKAGYAERYAFGNAYKLVTRSGIAELIKQYEQEMFDKLHVDLTKKIDISWEQHIHFKELGNAKMAHVWFEEHGKLCGDYVQRQEIDARITERKEKEKTELRGIRTKVFAVSREHAESNEN